MQKFFELIIKLKEVVVFLALSSISLSLITLGDISKVGGYRTLVVATIGFLQKEIFRLPNLSALQSENSALREINFNLSQRIMLARVAELENESLRRLVGLKERFPVDYEIADVIGSLEIDLRKFITINKGKNSGIKRLATVGTDVGLVGYVVSVSDNYSLVELINNTNVKVPSLILRSGVQGILNWDGDEFLLKDVPKFLDIKVGDTVVTSKHSLRFYPFIPIGVILSKEEKEGELFPRIVVKPFVNFNFFEQVFVLKNDVDKELDKLVANFEDIVRLSKQPLLPEQKLNVKKLREERKRLDSIAGKK
ncbi:MAG: rod shape-determining protein MreC [Ignavibacteria bacterium]|nr:rod shape-determining protein MreC [Ignavibacteria bacterium]